MAKDLEDITTENTGPKRKSGFFSKFGNGLKRTIAAATLVTTLGLGVLGCVNPIQPFPTSNNPPTSNPPTSPPPTTGSVDFSQVDSALSNLNEYNHFTDRPYSLTNEALPVTDTNADPVTYASISGTSPDGKVSYSLNGNLLDVTANQGNIGSFQIPITYNDNGKQEIANLEGYLYNLLDVQVNTQSDENLGVNQSSTIRLYTGIPPSTTKSPITPSQVYNEGTSTTFSTASDGGIIISSSDGTYHYQVDEVADPKAPLNSGFIMEYGAGNYAPLSNSTDGNSWISTTQFPNQYAGTPALTGDINQTVAFVPQNTLMTVGTITITPADFVNFAESIFTKMYPDAIIPYTYYKYYKQNIKNIEIARPSDLNSTLYPNSFISTDQANAISAANNLNTLMQTVAGTGINIQNDYSQGYTPHYSIDSFGDITANYEWDIWTPDDYNNGHQFNGSAAVTFGGYTSMVSYFDITDYSWTPIASFSHEGVKGWEAIGDNYTWNDITEYDSSLTVTDPIINQFSPLYSTNIDKKMDYISKCPYYTNVDSLGNILGSSF